MHISYGAGQKVINATDKVQDTLQVQDGGNQEGLTKEVFYLDF